MTKDEIRKEILRKRDEMTFRELNVLSSLVFEKIINHKLFLKHKNIYAFSSFQSEINTDRIIKHALSIDKNVYLPKVQKNKMIFLKIDENTLYKKSRFGIYEPEKEEENLENSGFVIFPGLAFDKKCNRIGYGAGYYDKYFEKIKDNFYKVGICFDNQILEHIETNKYDIVLDEVITPSYNIGAKNDS